MNGLEGYCKKLFVFERTDLLKDVREVQSFLKRHSHVSQMDYLAYVKQIQRYDETFRESFSNTHPLNLGNIFSMGYSNEELIRRTPEKSPEELRHVIDLSSYGLASCVEDVLDGVFVDDKALIEKSILFFLQ